MTTGYFTVIETDVCIKQQLVQQHPVRKENNTSLSTSTAANTLSRTSSLLVTFFS